MVGDSFTYGSGVAGDATFPKRLERLLADGKKDDLLTWEQLGVDGVFVDEAHLFKNLYRFTKMTRVAGLPLTNSERAFDLYLKTRYT
ncbi:MAG: SGNH/GDSL hydrolase family protein, partial [Anaerolineae bacterium]|nr:SGNH/GDSL hydrolase family protein [Anaerolineae bacterium]